MGWVVGYEGGSLFKPNQDVTFVEGLKITYMGFGLDYVEGDEIWYKDTVANASMYNYIPFTISDFNAGLQRDTMADLVTRIIKHSKEELDTYLGDRADIVVTYDTIDAGEDLSELVEDQVGGNGEDELVVGEACTTDSEEAGFVFHSVFDDANKCFKVGEGVTDTDCIVSAEGGCEALAEPAAQAVSHSIVIENMQFVDGYITIAAGDSMTWKNNGPMLHTVDLDGTDSSGNMAVGDIFEFTFNDAGLYEYFCALHPSMKGTITVE